jgi:DNA-3-methyladenine glycosylase I
MKKNRCAWVNLDNPLYIDYHDKEWGVPVHDDQVLFEMLCLEGAQAGLSWETVLRKREAYRKAFLRFNAQRLVKLKESQLEKILKDPGIVRNRLKVWSVRENARAYLEVKKEFGTFDQYLWNFVGGKPIQVRRGKKERLPSTTEISDRLSKDLKRRGFKFVGSTIVYAFMQAVGMVNDHSSDCFKSR